MFSITETLKSLLGRAGKSKGEEERRAELPDLTREEKMKIREIMRAADLDNGPPRTAQQSIPFERMFRDGTCRVRKGYYSRTIAFYDVNYQLAQVEERAAIFEDWCGFLNFFDSSVHVELTFLNMAADKENLSRVLSIPEKDDGFDDLRRDFSRIVRRQFEKGGSRLMKMKFLSFGIEAESMRKAKPRLAHLEADILGNFRQMGVPAYPLDGKERLRVMHDMFHIDGSERFSFDWGWLIPSGLTVKDFIAPTVFDFRKSRSFQMGGIQGAASYFSITASELNDGVLKELLEMDSEQAVTLHIRPVNQNDAVKIVKHAITELDRSKIDEQKKAVRSGYDMDVLPPELVSSGADAKAFLKELQGQNERMFLVTFLIMNTGRDRQELESNVLQASGIAQKHSCHLRRLDLQQEDSLMSMLPLAANRITIERQLTTSSTGILIPFTAQELFSESREAVYYGRNPSTGNLVMADRKELKAPNGVILGKPGSGKSFAAKREMLNVFLVTDDDIIVCDPEGEYEPLVRELHGQVIRIDSSSTQYINPLDINSNYSEEDSPVQLKAEFVLSLFELILGGKVSPGEQSAIDRCVHNVYREYFKDPRPERMPVLGDIYRELLALDMPDAKYVAAALSIYVDGTLDLFNHRTNVDIGNRVVCYDIRKLGKQLKKLGMLIVQDQVWGRVTANREKGKTTRYYMDEFHLLLREEQTAAYSIEIWKRFRKWGGIPTGITQNVKDFLESRGVSNILENSDFILMLSQAAEDRRILSERLGISEAQKKHIKDSGEGEGLISCGNIIVPFEDHFPTDTDLYRILTTKLTEVAEREA